MKAVIEWCPHCEEEVELIAEPHVLQHCPLCGKLIRACSLCNHNTCNCTLCEVIFKEEINL